MVMSISLGTKEAESTWKLLRSNWLIALVNRITLAITIIGIAVLLFRYQTLPPKIPLWYSQPWGNDQLAHPLWIFILPLGSIMLYVINAAVAIYFLSEYLVFAQIAFLTSLVVSVLSFIALVKILFLVT